MARTQSILFCFLICFFLLAHSWKTEAVEKSSTDVAAFWQGEWAWDSTADGDSTDTDNYPSPGNDFPAQGNISLYDCKNDICSFSLESGDVRSLCSAEGKVHLQSTNLASFDSTYPSPSKQCHLDLIVKDGKINIENESQDCRDNCGHLGIDFGSGYQKYSDKHYYKTGFDCHKAKTNIEITLCSDEHLADLDHQLAIHFRALKTQYTSDKMKKENKALSESQQAWIATRNKTCSNAADTKACLQPLYEKRIEELNHL